MSNSDDMMDDQFSYRDGGRSFTDFIGGAVDIVPMASRQFTEVMREDGFRFDYDEIIEKLENATEPVILTDTSGAGKTGDLYPEDADYTADGRRIYHMGWNNPQMVGRSGRTSDGQTILPSLRLMVANTLPKVYVPTAMSQAFKDALSADREESDSTYEDDRSHRDNAYGFDDFYFNYDS